MSISQAIVIVHLQEPFTVFVEPDATPYDDSKIKVLSIKTVYADQIRAGTKTFELRTYDPKIPQDRWLALYESSPTQAIQSVLKIGRTFKMNPEDAWHEFSDKFGIEAEDYFLYFRKREWAYGLEVKEVKNIEPLKLQYLREETGFAVPQMCMWLRNPHKTIQQATVDCTWNA